MGNREQAIPSGQPEAHAARADEIETVRPAPPRAAAPQQEAGRFAPGTIIRHYEIIRSLGQGGMGEVYLARDTRLGRLLALKFLRRVDAQASVRFVTEARATARLNHENIVSLYDIATHQGVPYLALEHVKGRTLAAWLEEREEATRQGELSRIPAARAAELLLPVARALICAHEAGVVHRDLKPDNIMLADNGGVKVLDFGVSKLLHERPDAKDASTSSASMDAIRALPAAPETQQGALLGTRAYMSPEQWGAGEVDERTDIWAMGILLHRMVTGEHPLAPLSPESLATVKMLDTPMPSVREAMPGIGKLGTIIDRCLIKRKEDRLSSARELLAELTAVARPRAAIALAEGANPYRGLSVFQEQDADRFFGREGSVEQVVARLAELPLLAIVGSSGAGKSSLVRAGVIAALKRGGEAWASLIVRPGLRPLTALAELIVEHASGQPGQGEREELRERLLREPGLFGVELRARARRRRERLLLFVDQFEEVYTLAAEDERAAFLACIRGAADDASSPLRVLLSIRHDFLDRVAATDRALAELCSRGTVLLGPIDREGLRRALVAPAEAAEHHFESNALVEEILTALERTAGALPLLQCTAARLWEARDRERRALTEASYRAFGGVAGALASHADSVVGGMRQSERRWARALFLRMVTPERTRAVVPRRELAEIGGASAPEVERVLGRLVDARLVLVEGAGRDESTAELVHESLLEQWPLLGRWLDEEQDDAHFRSRLRHAAKEWEASGRAEGLLWRGEAAEQAPRWQRRHRGDAGAALAPAEEQYLQAVVALLWRGRRRRRRIVTVVIAGLGAVALIVLSLWLRAEEQAARAQQEAARAHSQQEEAARSAARARNASRLSAAREHQEDPTTVLALVRELEPGPLPHGWDALARAALDAGVARAVLRHASGVHDMAVSPDGRHLAAALGDGTVQVESMSGEGMPLILRGHRSAVRCVAYSPDGRRILSGAEDGTVRIAYADGQGAPLVLDQRSRVHSAAWSPDGHRIVTVSEEGGAQVWRADGTGEPLDVSRHLRGAHSAAWSPDGRSIALRTFDGTVSIVPADGRGSPVALGGGALTVAWSPDSSRIAKGTFQGDIILEKVDGTGDPLVLRGHTAGITAIAFRADGRRLASGSTDRTVRVWDTEGAELQVLRGHELAISAIAWIPGEARTIVSSSPDKTARVWGAEDAGRPRVLRGHEDRISMAAWSPDGRRIASSSYDRTVRVWDAEGAGQPLILRGQDDLVESVAWSPDGSALVSTSDRKLCIWKADGTAPPLALRGHERLVRSARYSPDGRRIVTASPDRTARIWNADGTGEPVILRHEDPVQWAAWSPDGQRIVTASDRELSIWSADGAGAPRVLREPGEGLTSAEWSPDGRHIAAASVDGTVRIWDAEGQGEPRVLRGHEGHVTLRAGAYRPDGAFFVTASVDATVRLWDAAALREYLTLRAGRLAFDGAAWSPDGERILAHSGEGGIWIWSDLAPLDGPDDPKLWTASTYCPSVEVRERLLDMPEEMARADLARCERRVREARR